MFDKIATPSEMAGTVFQGVHTYNSAKVQVIIGILPLFHFSPDAIVTISRDQPTFKKIVDAYGNVARVLTRNITGTMQVHLGQASEGNILNTILQYIDELGKSAMLPILVTDLSGLSTYLSARGWIRKPPDGEFRKRLTTRVWTFDLANLYMATLGNLTFKPSGSVP